MKTYQSSEDIELQERLIIKEIKTAETVYSIENKNGEIIIHKESVTYLKTKKYLIIISLIISTLLYSTLLYNPNLSITYLNKGPTFLQLNFQCFMGLLLVFTGNTILL